EVNPGFTQADAIGVTPKIRGRQTGRGIFPPTKTKISDWSRLPATLRIATSFVPHPFATFLSCQLSWGLHTAGGSIRHHLNVPHSARNYNPVLAGVNPDLTFRLGPHRTGVAAGPSVGGNPDRADETRVRRPG